MPRPRPHNHIYMGDYNPMNGCYPFNQQPDMDQMNFHRFPNFRQNRQFGYGQNNMYHVHVVHRRNSGRHHAHTVHRTVRLSNNVDVPRAQRDSNNNSNNSSNNNSNSNNRAGDNGNNGSNANNTNRTGNAVREVCFICDDLMGNAPQPCIHLCDGGMHEGGVQPMEVTCTVTKATSGSSSPGPSEELSSEDRLEEIMKDIQNLLPEKSGKSALDALTHFIMARVQEVNDMRTEHEDVKRDLTKQLGELQQKSSKLDEREKILKKSEDRFGKEKKRFQESKKSEFAEIKRQWQQLKDEVARMEEVHKMQESRVKLDIGGRQFTTSTLTLSRSDKSMLGAMFSGRHEIKKEEDGTVFIDRDGSHFKYILNYLRDGGLTVDTLPRNKQTLKEIRNEAIYYQLNELVQTCEKLLCYRS